MYYYVINIHTCVHGYCTIYVNVRFSESISNHYCHHAWKDEAIHVYTYENLKCLLDVSLCIL